MQTYALYHFALAFMFFCLIGSANASDVVNDPRTQLATYISGSDDTARKEGQAAAEFYLGKFSKQLGIGDVEGELRFTRAIDLPVGKRYSFQQLAHGRRVLGATIAVTLKQNERDLYAISSSYSPEAAGSSSDLRLGADEAVDIAKKILPRANYARARELVVQVVPGIEYQAKLVWLVELVDDSVNSAKIYAVNATDGFVEDSTELRFSAKNRLIIDDSNGDTRAEGRARSRNPVVDDAYDFAGEVYDFFFDRYGFDSFDNKGAQIHTTVNKVLKDRAGRPVDNAYYHEKKMVYSPGMMTLDVLAHEFTHGVVKATAGLIYKGQSGALNESYADVFAVMVDSDDWLLGEDVTATGALRGKQAFRSMENPNLFDQPAKVSEYRKSCGVDNDGVHINSGIPNKGFYEVAKAVGRDNAGKIYFQALGSLTPSSDFNAHVNATLDATAALQPGKLQAVETALASVGLTPNMQIPVCGTASCPIAGSAGRMRRAERSKFVDNIAAAYRLRDEVFKQYRTIGDYSMKQFGEISGDLASSVFRNPSLARQTADYVRTLTPMINSIGDGDLERTVDRSLVDSTHDMVNTIVSTLKEEGKTEQAEKLSNNVAQFELEKVVGKSYQEAMAHIRTVIEQQGSGGGSGSGSAGSGQAEKQGGGAQSHSENEGQEGQGQSEKEGQEGQGQSEKEGQEGQGQSEKEGQEGQGQSEKEGQEGQGQSEKEGQEGQGQSENEGQEGQDQSEKEGQEGQGQSEKGVQEGQGQSEKEGQEGQGQSEQEGQEGQGGTSSQQSPQMPEPRSLPGAPTPREIPLETAPKNSPQAPRGGSGEPSNNDLDLEEYETPEGGECC